jgi:hypothetical protein
MIDINNLGDMDIENMTSEQKKEVLDAMLERASKTVWKQQYLILKEAEKEIYRVEMLWVNEAFPEYFYEYLGLNVDWDKWELKETEVDFVKLFYAWWSCIHYDFLSIADSCHKDIYYEDKRIVAGRLSHFDITNVGIFFTALRKIKKYTHQSKEDSDILTLDDRYKLYVELCDWKPTKNKEE